MSPPSSAPTVRSSTEIVYSRSTRASLSTIAAASTANRCPSSPPVETGRGTIGYGDVLSQVFRSRFPAWSFGVTLSYPLGMSTADADLARAHVQYSQSQIQLRDRELQIATQVREIARQVNTNLKRVQATAAARELSQQRLVAEQKKFAAGMSTSFVVFQAQRDLAAAQAAELNAILEYNKSLVDFETVQEAPVSGVSGGLTVAGSVR